MLRDVLEYKRSSSLNEPEELEARLDINAVALETVWEALAVATLFSNIHNTCFVLAARFSLKLKVSFLCVFSLWCHLAQEHSAVFPERL